MPGSQTAPGRTVLALFSATVRIAFRSRNVVGARDNMAFAAQWLAYASPCRRFAADLAINGARLGAGVARATFTVEDFHLILLAGLPTHCGEHFSSSVIWRFFDRHEITFKKRLPTPRSSNARTS